MRLTPPIQRLFIAGALLSAACQKDTALPAGSGNQPPAAGAQQDFKPFRFELIGATGNFGVRGPSPITGGQAENLRDNPGMATPANAVAGAIRAVVADPTNPEVLYVGTVNGGVWQTQNARMGLPPSWTALTDTHGSLSIGSMTIDAAGTTIVAGLGNYSSYFSAGGAVGGFIVKTPTTAWTTRRPAVLANLSLNAVEITGTDLLVASDSTGGGVFTGPMGSETGWVRVNNGLPSVAVSDLVRDKSNANAFYAAVPGSVLRGIYFWDGTNTWVERSINNAVLRAAVNNANRIRLASGSGGRIYAVVTQTANTGLLDSQVRYIGFSDDTGLNWTAMDVPRTALANGNVGTISQTGGVAVVSVPTGHGIPVAINDPNAFVRLNGVTCDPALSGANRDFQIQVTSTTTFTILNTSAGGCVNSPGGTWQAFHTMHPGGQATKDLGLVVDPTDQTTIYLSGDRQQKSVGGATDFSARIFRGSTAMNPNNGIPSNQWTAETHAGTASGSAPHADSRNLVFDAQSATGELLDCNDGGIARRTSPRTAGGDWFSLNGNLQITEIHSIAFDSFTGTLVAGAQDTGTPFEPTMAPLVRWPAAQTGDGGDVAVEIKSVANRSVRYMAFNNFRGAIRREFDNTSTEKNSVNLALTPTMGTPTPVFTGNAVFVTPIETNKNQSTVANAKRIVIGAANGVYTSVDSGATVSQVNGGAGLVATAMWFGHASNVELLFVGTTGGLFRKSTAADSLVQVGAGVIGGVADVAVHPTNANIVACATSGANGQVFLSTDGGVTWANMMMVPFDVTGDLADSSGTLLSGAIHSIVIANNTTGGNDKIFVGADKGVWLGTTLAAGQGHWNKVGTALPTVPVYDMDLDANDNLYLGTLGRGAWVLTGASAIDLPPTARCKDAIVAAGPMCTASPMASVVDNGSADPDGTAVNRSISPAGPFALNVPTDVTLTVSNASGTASCGAKITVTDQTAPVVPPLSPATANNCGPINLPDPPATDDCSTILPATRTGPTIFPVGPTPITWTVTDSAGNSTTANQVVNVSQPSLRVTNFTFSNWTGRMKIANDGPGPTSRYRVEFDVPLGFHCTAESNAIPPGATLSPLVPGTNGEVDHTASNHCIFTWDNGPTIQPNTSTPTLYWSADKINFTPDPNPTAVDTLCSCVPDTDPVFCQKQGKNCGTVTGNDNCGFPRTASCGGCSGGAVCGIGVANRCGLVLLPTADAYVREGDATTNFGLESELRVKSQPGTGNTRWSYLKFNITGMSGTVTNAKLRLFGSHPTDSAQAAAYSVNVDSWTENGITWSNKPPTVSKLSGNVTVTTTLKDYDFTVTSFVASEVGAGNMTVSLAVKPETDNPAGPTVFQSREAANPPRLIITP